MIPENRLSTTPVYAPFIVPNSEPDLLTSREMGGSALNNPVDGLQVKVWTAGVVKGDDIDTVQVWADDVAPVDILSAVEITEISLAFDQNMQPSIAYVAQGNCFMYWFDTLVEDFVTTAYGPTFKNPRLTLDDHRPLETGSNDVIFAYIRDGNLYYREQRDRYGVEYLLYADLNHSIVNPVLNAVGMTTGFLPRLQFEVRGYFRGS